jgi:FkbM family methyltransferase
MKRLSGAPLSLRVVRNLQRLHVKGASFLMRCLLRIRAFDIISEYNLGKLRFSVPLWRLQWDAVDVANYEAKLIDVFCEAVAPLHNATLFDCGADIGTFSSLVCSRTPQITRVIALEPNPDVLQFLKVNLANLPVVAELVPKGAANFDGQGSLARPTYDQSDHARFLIPGQGSIEAIRIDRLGVRDGDIAFKIDIEGGELEALKGATMTIKSARKCVVALEAHPAVAKRIGRDPVECLRFLNGLRPFQFIVAETGERPSMASPLLKSEQVEVWNVVGWAS